MAKKWPNASASKLTQDYQNSDGRSSATKNKSEEAALESLTRLKKSWGSRYQNVASAKCIQARLRIIERSIDSG